MRKVEQGSVLHASLVTLIAVAFCGTLLAIAQENDAEKKPGNEVALVRKVFEKALQAEQQRDWAMLYGLFSTRLKNELKEKHGVRNAEEYGRFTAGGEAEWSKHQLLDIRKEFPLQGKYAAWVRTHVSAEGREMDLEIRYILVREGKEWRIDDWNYVSDEHWDEHYGQELQERLKRNPADTEALISLGTHYYLDVHEYEKALVLYERVIELRPQSYEGYYFAGLVMPHVAREMDDRAVKYLRKAIELNSDLQNDRNVRNVLEDYDRRKRRNREWRLRSVPAEERWLHPPDAFLLGVGVGLLLAALSFYLAARNRAKAIGSIPPARVS